MVVSGRRVALYPILDTGLLAARSCGSTTAANAFLLGGARILQFRHKGHWTREIFGQAQAIAQLCAEHDAAFVVNDRADMAVLLNAGLHVGQEDLAPTDVRRLHSGLLGFSTHNAEQLAAAGTEPVDYVALGPIFATSSKLRTDPVVGIENLRAWRKSVPRPLVAIGGITRANARSVLEAGAGSVAVIGDLLPEHCTESALRERMEEWQQLIRT